MDRFGGSGERDTGNGTGTPDLIEAVRELITLMGRGGITELDLTTGGVSIRLRGNGGGQALAALPSTTGDSTTTVEQSAGHVITAPMIGTYYAAPAPGDAPFVQVGDEVEVGQTVGIIEAMKIMNEIVADRPGIVAEVMVENAQAVEYGSPLLRVTEPTDALP
jgi:acetyl-CoA carboxylase biotin carboxyl carrier protein